MDEITIGDKTYVSSKQAAKITGYAKDYVGQLCREGRVEARLVGRNWYVLDSAIREHRFGKEDEVEPVGVLAEPVVDRVSTWQKPQYVAETPVLVPEFTNKAPETIGSPAIADMQSAWREWFDEKKLPQAVLPDGSEDFKDEYLPVIIPETVPEPVLGVAEAPIHQDSDQEEMVVISRIRHQEPESITVTEADLQEEKVELYRSNTTTNTPRKEYGEVYSEQQRFIQPAPKAMPQPAVAKVESSSVVLRALFIVVSVVAVLVALIGTGNAEQLLAGTSLDYGIQKSIVDFLGGKSTYESSL